MPRNLCSYDKWLDQNDKHVVFLKSINLKELQSIQKFGLFFQNQPNLLKLSKSCFFGTNLS